VNNESTIKVSVYRSPELDSEDIQKEGEYKEYEIPKQEQMTIMSALNYITENIDSSLAFYRSCRIGKCTGCLVDVNGQNKLSCVTLLENGMKIGPAKNYKIIKDLVVDFSSKIK
jgi:succinate dehydrogenase/fumarate reductase iron-sulfur protein